MEHYTPPACRLFKRGNPDGMTIDGKINQLIHSFVPASRDGCHGDRPLCGNGSFHLYYTDNRSAVNCPVCKEKLAVK